MKKNLLWLLIPAILLAVWMPAMAQHPDILQNGGFENWTAGPGGPPDNWVYGTASVTATQEASVIRSGSYAAKVVWTNSGTLQFNSVSMPVQPSKAYVCSLYVYDNDTTGSTPTTKARVRPYFYWTGPNVGTYPSWYTTDSAGYKLYIYSDTSRYNATALTLQMRIYGGASGRRDSAWFDDFTIRLQNFPPTVNPVVTIPGGPFYANTDVSVKATITDLDGTIASDNLHLQLNGGGYSTVAHDSIVGNDYYYHIGTNAVGTVVDYYVSATDDDGATTTSAPGSYTPVNNPPAVGAPIRVPAGAIYAATDVSVHSLITDSDGTIASDSLYIDLDGGGYNPVGSDSLVGNDYWFHIGTHALGTVVTYYAVATDNGGTRTVGSSDTYTVLPPENVPPSVGAPVRIPSGDIFTSTDVSVHSLITDPDGTIASESLYVDLDGAGYNPVGSDSLIGNDYWFHIGTHALGTVVTYYAVATDDDGARTVGSSDSYTVINNPPVIGTVVRTPVGKIFYDHNVLVHAPITDVGGTIASDNLYLQLNGAGFNPIAHDSINAGNYWYTIGPRATGTAVDYYISATDNEGSTSTSSTYSYTVHGTVPISLIQHSAGSGTLPNCYPSDSMSTVEQVSGIIVGRYGGSATYHKRAFVQDSQDPWSGLYVYGLPDTVQVGDSITVRGSLTEYNAETEMGSPYAFLTKHGHGYTLPTPTVLTAAQFPADSCSALSEPYEGMLIQIYHITLIDTFPLFGTNRGDFWAVDGSGDTCVVANDQSTANGADSCVFQVGHTYTWIKGVARYTYGRYRIMPRDKYDLYNANGTIAGVVYGPDGITPLSGVTITTYDAANNVVGTNTSGPGGDWTWNSGSDGVYHEALHKSGYVDTTIANIVVYGNQTTNVSTSMRVQEVFCTGNNIFTVKFASLPGTDPDCWPSPRAGQVDSVCGIITAVKQGASSRYFIQDQGHTAWGALYGYDYTLPDGTPIVPVLGDYVQVTSKVSEYNGWTELDSLIGYTVIIPNQPLPDTSVVTIAMFTPNTCNYIAEPYESELVRFNNVTIHTAQGTYGNYWITDPSTGDSIRIANDLWYSGTNQPDPLPSPGFVYSSLVGVMRWEGRNTGSNIRGWILLPRFASDYTLMPAPELVYVYPLDETRLAVTFSRGMNPGTISNASNYSTFNGLSIIGAAVDPPGALYPRKAILTTAVQPGNTVDTLIVNGVCDSMGVCMLTPHKKLFHSGFTTISYIQTPNAGGDSTIWIDHIFMTKGVCVSDSIVGHYNNYFMTDQSGPPYRGIHLYFSSFLPRPVLGDTFVVTGHCVEFNRETEIQDFSWFNNVRTIGAGPAPIPSKVTTSDLLTLPEQYESDLVTVCDSFTVTSLSSGDAYGCVIHSITTPAESLIVNKDGAWTKYTYVPVVGNVIRGITGVYRFSRSKWRISPRLNDDFNSFETWCVEHNPIIGVAPSSISHFQETDINHTFIGDFTISNTGDGPLNFTAAAGLTWITVGTPAGTVPASGSLPIDLTINTTGITVGTYNDNIVINSNDLVTPSVSLPVTVIVSQVVPDVDHFDVTITAGNDTTIALNIGNGAAVDVRVDLAAAPIDWLSVDPAFAIIPSGGSAPFQVTVNAAQLPPGDHNGTITITSSNLAASVIELPIVVVVEPGGPVCDYIPGNVNSVGGFTGLDVVYAVAYLKGGPPPGCPCECTPGHTWYVCGDVNASCTFTGLDVTYMVAYLKGGPALMPCPDCPPVSALQSNPATPQGQ